jgi:ubiquinone/menaquinone biosynthesis C-methylase UbiE
MPLKPLDEAPGARRSARIGLPLPLVAAPRTPSTFILIMLLGACTPRSRHVPSDGGSTPPVASHGPAHPPIDCPLRAQGTDPTHLKPFENVEKYIAFLDRPERALWQKPDEVVAALHLADTDTVVDLGAGSGYFTFRIAKVVPRGTVIAVDVEPEMVRHIHHKAMTDGVTNVRVVLGKPDDPGVPGDADVVLVCDVLHHVANRPVWLGRLATEMKPSARLVLVEFKEGKLPEGPPESVKLPRAELLRLTSEAGFWLDAEQPALLSYQTFMVFKKMVSHE